MPSTKPFLSFVIDPKLLRQIDDYRFENKFPSRAAAIVSLLQQALSATPHGASIRKAIASAKR